MKHPTQKNELTHRQQCNQQSFRLNLYCFMPPYQCVPMERVKVPTDIALKPPPGTYAQIYSRSGLVATHCTLKVAQLIQTTVATSPFYCTTVTKIPFHIHIGDCIAQLVFHSIVTPNPNIVSDLDTTTRGEKGFGSTGQDHIKVTATISSLSITPSEGDSAPHTHNSKETTATNVPDILYQIWIHNDPFDNLLSYNIKITGDHPTLGMIFKSCPTRNHPKLISM
jgi:dUTP pyrophosphatase